MSATLTWREVGPHTSNAGASTIGFLTDIKTLMDSKSGDSNYKWQVASSSLVTTPIYLTLKRKDGSAGRILIIGWTTLPANNNTNILDGAPTATAVYMAWFPNGNVDTPSNLTAASGTVMGDDTDCVKAQCILTAITTAHAASNRAAYVESEAGVYVFTQSAAGASTVSGGGAGDLIVDDNDVAYGAVVGPGSGAWSTVTSNASPALGWAAAPTTAGAGSGTIRTNYGLANRCMYTALQPTGSWTYQAYGSVSDPIVNSIDSEVTFLPIQLIGNRPPQGITTKLRQVAFGPGATTGWQAVSTTGPTRVAFASNPSYYSSVAASPWFTQFKI